ncbi:MAG: DUF2752 domain-containing protein [Oscillospiraceae bacterium]|nr:DUF2752 domain-containing protein [Oscillospiraceae bacterium]
MLKRFQKAALWGGFVFILIIIFTIWTDRTGIGIPCPFRTLTHLNCPGCGNTRAALACLHLEFRKALQYNYLFPAEFLYLIWTALKTCINYIRTGTQTLVTPPKRINILFLICLIIWLIVRNILHI